MNEIRTLAERAKSASRRLAAADRSIKDEALRRIASRLRQEVDTIGRANARDTERARAAGMADAMVDRLAMGPKVVEATAQGVEHIVTLPDPVGSRSGMQQLPNGLLVGKQRLPLGVVAMVYESRPNVTIDAAALCIKSGNATLLRGGKEAKESNQALGEILKAALEDVGLPADAVQIIPPSDREGIRELVHLTGLVDLAIPRGGEGLIRFVTENARVPVVQHYKGVCHLFLDDGCDHAMAADLAVNSKAQRVSVCNSLECLLVHENEAETLLPLVVGRLQEEGVEVRGCPRTRQIVSTVEVAGDDDWGAEFLAKIIAVRVVPDLDGALEHVARYGSNHTDAICTESHRRAQRWLREVESSCVLVNASTRFNDGFQLGLGAEIGISTSKMHAYGPMGLEGLTAEKWVVLGQGQVRTS